MVVGVGVRASEAAAVVLPAGCAGSAVTAAATAVVAAASVAASWSLRLPLFFRLLIICFLVDCRSLPLPFDISDGSDCFG